MGNGASFDKKGTERHPAYKRRSHRRKKHQRSPSISSDENSYNGKPVKQTQRKKSNLRRTKRSPSMKHASYVDDSDSNSFTSDYEHQPTTKSKRKSPRKYDDSESTINDMLTQEELFELTSRELRKKCNNIGLDTSTIINKSEFVEMLHNYYRLSKGETNGTNSAKSTHQKRRSSLLVSPNFSGRRGSIMLNDESEQLIEILYEIIPFFGQGDLHLDSTVRETIQRLPHYAIDTPDPTGNTILMLACQFRASELVSLIITKGSDVNLQNNDGATCLHFSCYSESFSAEVVQVR